MRAEILSIGTELLLGQITDTNASFLAAQLPALGIGLYHISQVGDNLQRLVGALQLAWDRADLLILTGGLGPTQDDLTREAISALLGEQMTVQADLEVELRAFFARRGVPMPESNVKQATLIPSARVLPNPVGTAPGWWVERDGHIIVAMPGVPSEMYRMWRTEVVPQLRERAPGSVIISRTLKVLGLGESAVEERLLELVPLPNPTVATYAKSDGIHVRITAQASDAPSATALLLPVEQRARALLESYVYGMDDETLSTHIAHLLVEQKLSLASAETTSAGALAAALATASDSTDYQAAYLGSLVLGSPTSDGPSAADLALGLAQRARATLASDVGLGVCGEEDEQGLVRQAYVAVVDAHTTHTAAAGMSVALRDAGPRLVQQALLALYRYVRHEA